MADGELKHLDVIAAPIRHENRVVGIFGIVLPTDGAAFTGPEAGEFEGQGVTDVPRMAGRG